ncbi:AAA domain-containing protein [Hoylesella timonensis]|uniref:DEAD/DEAH box helicase n=1 Tax=Hoylesella timonensis TaxID=386414 RepID=UPI00336A9207
MNKTDTYITAKELYQQVGKIIETNEHSPSLVNKMMHETLVLTCAAGLRSSTYSFGDLRARVDRLCSQCQITAQDTHAIHRMRRHSNSSSRLLPEDVLYDLRSLCVFISAVFREAIPSFLVEKLPARGQELQKGLRLDKRYIRCIVRHWDNQYIWVLPDGDTDEQLLQVEYASKQQFADMSYLQEILRTGMQLNLLDCQIEEHLITPRLIVVEPDCLIDISSLAACFTDYGHHPAVYTLNRMREKPNTQHTILGNFAGCALDNMVFAQPDRPFSLAETLKENYQEKALEYCTCTTLNPTLFKTDAAKQAQNMQQIVTELFKTYQRSHAILEPSFVCETLGIQGRVDLMTTDFRLLVEQKSGKNMNLEYNRRNSHGTQHVESHYVQTLLYAGVLKYNFQLSNSATQIFLLYSKYPLPAGLLSVARLDMLLQETIKLRNLIVATDMNGAIGGFGDILNQLNARTLNTARNDTFFYNRYLLPQIKTITQPLQEMSSLENAYFCRMMTFVLKEQLISKAGSTDGNGRSNADLWSMPLSEKREMGNIYTGLHITKKTRTGQRGFDEITLSVPDQGAEFLPNFRRGDMVYLYGYHPDAVPDVRRSIVFKGFMKDIKTHEIVIHLADAQQNEDILFVHRDEDTHPRRTPLVYAVEHSASDASGSSAFHALHTLMTTHKDRRDLLLGQRKPQVDKTRTLTKSYHPDYDSVLLQAKQACDYFLLVGPPGTGKTSMALRYMVEEELANSGTNLLLMAYTNRAVDEICSMLTSADLDYLRLGNEFSCEPRFTSHLLGQAIKHHTKLTDLQRRLEKTRIIVSTTSMMMHKPFIFALKHFSLAIVDEASQILEPNLIGILAHHCSTANATTSNEENKPGIDKFILIGDYKQLPAVVQQSEEESKVDAPELLSIGLSNCRNSLFERLIHWEEQQGRTDFTGILHKQGRMHPELSAFPNRMFYFKEQLQPVPLPHQLSVDIGYLGKPKDETDQQLVQHRLLYYPSKKNEAMGKSDKVNIDEAQKVADLLNRIYTLTQKNFDPLRTVGVIVPYRNQIAMIRQEIEKTGNTALKDVCIDTVERYQGSQRDIIIYSFTVQHRYQLDFLTSNSFYEDDKLIDRKLNVAITRARKQLIILGNKSILSANPLFKALIEQIPHHLR